jgi:hypothetical protein
MRSIELIELLDDYIRLEQDKGPYIHRQILRGIRSTYCQDLQAEHKNMRFELIELIIIMLSWMWDLPIDLYPGAPPSQYRLWVSQLPTNQPLKQGYIATHATFKYSGDP